MAAEVAYTLAKDKKEWEGNVHGFTAFMQQRSTVPLLTTMMNRMNSLMPFQNATHILDVGCGGAIVTRTLFDAYQASLPPSTTYNLIDFADAVIQVLKDEKEERVDEDFWKNAHPAVADAQNLSMFANNSHSHIIGSFVYILLPDPPKALREARRVLQPGGVLGITCPRDGEWWDIILEAAQRVRPGLKVKPLRFPETWGMIEGVTEQLRNAGYKDVEAGIVSASMPAQSTLGTSLIKSRSPSVKSLCPDFSDADINKTCDEWHRIVKERGITEVVGHNVYAVGRK